MNEKLLFEKYHKNSCILIPSRIGSTRFPEKMIADIGNGQTLVEKVFSECTKTDLDTYVLTDYTNSDKLDIEYIMTDSNLRNGTERCSNAIKNNKILEKYDYIINVQGDMIDVNNDMILNILKSFNDHSFLVTLYSDMSKTERLDRNVVKAIHSNDQARWFCRDICSYGDRHIGVYGYSYHMLRDFYPNNESKHEKIEKLEQLRWIESGMSLHVKKVNFNGIEINTKKELEMWKECHDEFNS